MVFVFLFVLVVFAKFWLWLLQHTRKTTRDIKPELLTWVHLAWCTVCDVLGLFPWYSVSRQQQSFSSMTIHALISVQWHFIRWLQFNDNSYADFSSITIHTLTSVQWQFTPCVSLYSSNVRLELLILLGGDATLWGRRYKGCPTEKAF